MLFDKATLAAIAAGEVDLAFRRWRRPTIAAGGTLRTAVGILSIDRVERIDAAAIGDDEAARAGFASRARLLADLDRRTDGTLYRITFHLAGEDPRQALRQDTAIDAGACDAIRRRLAALDGDAPWTMAVLAAIGGRDGITAALLARRLRLDKLVLKRRILQLKELGLTESLTRGYRLAPRGRTFVARLAETEEQGQ